MSSKIRIEKCGLCLEEVLWWSLTSICCMVFRTDLLLVSLTETLHTYDYRWLRGHVIFFVTCSKLRRKVTVWYKTKQMWVLFDVAAVPCFFNLIVNDLWYKQTFYRAVTSWTLKKIEENIERLSLTHSFSEHASFRFRLCTRLESCTEGANKARVNTWFSS